jgi:hypothetical protein
MTEYVSVKIGRLPEKADVNYEVLGLPEGGNFKDRDEYDRYQATWLKLNGYGFACSGAEISEEGETVEINQEVECGSLEIEI